MSQSERETLLREGDLTAQAHLTSRMLLRGGAGLSRQEIADRLSSLDAQVSVSDASGQTRVHLVVTKRNFVDAFRLLMNVLRNPSFSPQEFDELKSQEIASAEKQGTDPVKVTLTGMRRELAPYPPGDPRSVELPRDSAVTLKATSLKDVQGSYPCFYGSCGAILGVVGEVDAPSLNN